MGIDIPTGTPSAGDVFNWAGTQYVYRTNPDRWDTNGFIGPDPDPFADFILTTYVSDGVTSTTHIGMHDETPFNFAGSGNGAGIAADSVATSGVVALWSEVGQGSAVLLPTDLVALSGASIMGSDISTFTGTTDNMNVHLSDGTLRGAQFQNLSSGFGRAGGGPGQVMSGGVGIGFAGSGFTTSQDVTRIDFRIPSGNGATGIAGNTVALLLETDTIVKTLTSSGTAGNDGNSRFYNYRWGVLNTVFQSAT